MGDGRKVEDMEKDSAILRDERRKGKEWKGNRENKHNVERNRRGRERKRKRKFGGGEDTQCTVLFKMSTSCICNSIEHLHVWSIFPDGTGDSYK